MNKRKIGSCYEEQAAEFLRDKGYIILQRNFRSYRGEIDIIAQDEDSLVFVEVKYRLSDLYGRGEFHVDKRKQLTIYKVAEQYLLWKYPEGDLPPCRFDVIAIDGSGEISHYENAFCRE